MKLVEGVPKSKHPLYSVWYGMMDRCYRRKNTGWKRYGGRGIRVCRRWWTLDNFVADMGDRPVGTTLGRIDNNRGYSPRNCRWETRKQQSRNTSANRVIEYKGMRKCLTQWAEEFGINPDVLYWRIVDGKWPVGDALTLASFPVDGIRRERRLAEIRGELSEYLERRKRALNRKYQDNRKQRVRRGLCHDCGRRRGEIENKNFCRRCRDKRLDSRRVRRMIARVDYD